VKTWSAFICFLLFFVFAHDPAATETGKTNIQPRIGEPTTNATHWSLKPVNRPKIPPVGNPKWKPRNPIDNFIFARLAEAKLSPSGKRRVARSFDGFTLT